ncbi:MAG: 3-dehydroquinate synthase [Clostridia bacterium]|nr:3-dehydroquinate synthase [Clostridia bacterium]
MKIISVKASTEYNVYIGSGLIAKTGAMLAKTVSPSCTAFVISDENVFRLYGERVLASLEEAGFRTGTFVFEPGEQSKNIATYGMIVEKMAREKLTRSDVVVALGGGVTGDISGFASSTFLRGIKYVQVPTTLLAAVDSSVGGKTAIDLKAGKNLLGAFWQPCVVFCDTDTFSTLPEAEYLNGCAEIIKYGMLGSRELFESVAAMPVSLQYDAVVAKCVDMKREIVENDEFDRGGRMVLNLGHTVGHAIENRSGYRVPHGMAVAAGMCVITRAAENLSFAEKGTTERLLKVIRGYGLPDGISALACYTGGDLSVFSAESLSESAMNDKKASGSGLTLVVPERIGECALRTIKKEEFIDWLRAGGVK